MLDNQLITLIISTIIQGEAIAGISGTPIAQAFQPTQQGVSSAPIAFITKIADHPYGGPTWTDVYSSGSGSINHTESQQYETTFQISCLATQNPALPNQMTASDILNLMRSILQSQITVDAFQAQGVGIERITQVRNPPFQDDRQQYEYAPNFDFVMIHYQTITSSIPIANPIVPDFVVVQ